MYSFMTPAETLKTGHKTSKREEKEAQDREGETVNTEYIYRQ